MTLPDERYRSVRYARMFLQDLMNPSKTPGVPKIIRSQASGILRHFPSDWDMDRAAEAAPDVFASKMEPVYRMIKKFEEGKKDET